MPVPNVKHICDTVRVGLLPARADTPIPPPLWLAVGVQAIAAAQQAAEQAEATAQESVQQLSEQLQEQAAENSKLKEQLKKLNADLLDLCGQLDVQTTQQSMLEAREQQHQQQLQEQTAKMKEKAAELETATKELQVGCCCSGVTQTHSSAP